IDGSKISMTLRNVLHAPELSTNLLFIIAMVDKEYDAQFTLDTVYFKLDFGKSKTKTLQVQILKKTKR
ncbi:hypothetical protein HK098_006250, partial [Nowakowskiella sp. JEL0407]